ncbi:hypothetical protein CONPUDRAFT_156873 [Coniophora puteana RWD-64-598 SS2]|uniref:DUF6532 domain-containing protein n=1 Tax=Coniophora puteana (strain RWD-64-598) TaxID=741705 RepID=A0A5M3MF77_CONPW|nr:uncharacterized protein CONPUDRAFT_156873 [Coniophora puteana RWD-64-598 SS2]EIW77687.1 hypothetical protein CONPUDRAFT_156873 [Coniophora puteana RWD-64-598 SS2]
MDTTDSTPARFKRGKQTAEYAQAIRNLQPGGQQRTSAQKQQDNAANELAKQATKASVAKKRQKNIHRIAEIENAQLQDDQTYGNLSANAVATRELSQCSKKVTTLDCVDAMDEKWEEDDGEDSDKYTEESDNDGGDNDDNDEESSPVKPSKRSTKAKGKQKTSKKTRSIRDEVKALKMALAAATKRKRMSVESSSEDNGDNEEDEPVKNSKIASRKGSKGKRVKRSVASGLAADWQKQAKGNKVKSKAHSHDADVHNNLEDADTFIPIPDPLELSRASSRSSFYDPTARTDDAPDIGGKFDEDESEAALARARASKASKVSQGATADRSANAGESLKPNSRSTAQMGLVITAVNADTAIEKVITGTSAGTPGGDPPGGGRSMYADLPFVNEEGFKRRWEVVIRRTCNWAGTVDDPWGTNTHPDLSHTIQAAWAAAFADHPRPDVRIFNTDGNQVILKLVTDSLNTWRSEFGKRAIKLLHNFFQSSLTHKDLQDKRAKWVSLMSASPGDPRPPFLYAAPHDRTGAWRSPLVLQTFALHIRRAAVPTAWGAAAASGHGDKPHAQAAEDRLPPFPVGALALSAAAVERALFVFKDGDNAKEKRGSDGSRLKIPGVSFDGMWAPRTSEFVKKGTKIISATGWVKVFDATAPYLPTNNPPAPATNGEATLPTMGEIAISDDE